MRAFSEIGIDDVALVGGKNASLGEMYRAVTPKGILIPDGFAITAEAYRQTLTQGAVWTELRKILNGVGGNDLEDLGRRAAAAREIIYRAPLPNDVVDDIGAAWTRLFQRYGPELTVAVRSSATAEDLAEASFAGQHESYLNVHGEAAMLEMVRRCYASLFTDRALRRRPCKTAT